MRYFYDSPRILKFDFGGESYTVEPGISPVRCKVGNDEFGLAQHALGQFSRIGLRIREKLDVTDDQCAD